MARFFGAIALVATTGCSGGAVSPSASPTPYVYPATETVSLNVVTPTAAVSVGPGNWTTVAFPTLTSTTSGTMTVTGSASLPSGVLGLGSTPSGLTLVGFFSVTTSATVTFPAGPQIGFNLEYLGTVPNVQYYVAYLAPGAASWVQPSLGPSTGGLVIGSPAYGQTASGEGIGPSLAVGFQATNQPVTLVGGKTYDFALYSVPN